MSKNRSDAVKAGLSGVTKRRHEIDSAAYLKELRYEKPKEVFRAFREILKKRLAQPGLSLLDAGCATGELLYYLKDFMHGSSCPEGMDISPVMIARAKRNVRGVNFKLGSVLNRQFFRRRRYDIVVLSGVMQIFDEPAIVLKNMLACAKEGGTVIVSGPFNDDPIDVFMRYRRSGRPGARMEMGWNFFSCQTIENIVKKMGYKLRIRWQEFKMPYAIQKRADDPMRTWTIRTEHNPFQLVNGASQLVKMKILIMDIIKVPPAR